MGNSRYRKFYLASVLVLLFVCAYPFYMAYRAVEQYLIHSAILSPFYPRYIIPYVPIALSLLLVACLMPLALRWLGRWSLLGATLLGVGAFLLCEQRLENLIVVDGDSALALQCWQYSLCVATPEVLSAIGLPAYAPNNPAFKLHFYLIAILIILPAVNLLHSLSRRARGEGGERCVIAAQGGTFLFFLGLCLLACFTAFFRNGVLRVSPVSALLMAAFFLAFGLNSAAYIGGFLVGKPPLRSVVLPALTAVAAVGAMYAGELVLMGGALYRFGVGFPFAPLLGPLAPVDLLLIILAGALAAGLMTMLNRSRGIRLSRR